LFQKESAIATTFLTPEERREYDAVPSRVLVGLNKGESYHALARALVIVLGGILRSRSIEDQVNQITCLRLLAMVIIAWNSVYMGEAIERLRNAGYRVGDDQLSHIYPMFTEHLNLIGEYRFPCQSGCRCPFPATPLPSRDRWQVEDIRPEDEIDRLICLACAHAPSRSTTGDRRTEVVVSSS
jgi:hypothetical protein